MAQPLLSIMFIKMNSPKKSFTAQTAASMLNFRQTIQLTAIPALLQMEATQYSRFRLQRQVSLTAFTQEPVNLRILMTVNTLSRKSKLLWDTKLTQLTSWFLSPRILFTPTQELKTTELSLDAVRATLSTL